MDEEPTLEASQHLPGFPYARYAELIGLRGIRVNTPEQVGDAWDEALAADCPVVLEAVSDPDVPPLPPHITFEQAKSMALALAKGDVDARGVVRRSASQKLKELLRG